MEIVEVVWDDAHCSLDDTSTTSAAKTGPVRTRSIGYLVAETESGVVIATDTYPKEPKEAKAPHFIPWGIIVNYYELVE